MWDLFWTAIAPDDLGCSNPRRSVGGWHLDCRGRLVHQSASRGTMTKRAVNSDFLAKLTWIGLTTLLAVGCSPDEARLTSGRVKIDLGTHRLEARIEGEPKGRPTVVIESGLGAKIDDWARRSTIGRELWPALGTNIHRDRPQLVAEEVTKMLALASSAMTQ